MSYKDYLKSKDWQEKRAEALRFWGGLCWVCRSRERIHVHHLYYYKNLSHNRTKDFRLLCQECHSDFHRWFGPIKGRNWRMEKECERWARKRRKTLSAVGGEQAPSRH